MNLYVSPPSCKQGGNIGLLVEGNAYFVADFPRYLDMSPSQLDATIQRLQQLRQQTFSRFIRHRTVPWFGCSCAILVAALMLNPALHLLPLFSEISIAWIVIAVLPSMYAMDHQREDLLNALKLLKVEIKKAKAARATK